MFSHTHTHTHTQNNRCFFLKENILEIKEGIFKPFNSLTKSIFGIKTYLDFFIGSSPIQNGRSPCIDMLD